MKTVWGSHLRRRRHYSKQARTAQVFFMSAAGEGDPGGSNSRIDRATLLDESIMSKVAKKGPGLGYFPALFTLLYADTRAFATSGLGGREKKVDLIQPLWETSSILRRRLN